MNRQTSSNYILIYTKNIIDRPEYMAWLLSSPVYLLTSDLDFDALYSLLDSFCGELITLIELDYPYRTSGVCGASKGAWQEAMKKRNDKS